MDTAVTTNFTLDVTSYGRTRITVGDYALVFVPRESDDRSVWSLTRLFGAIDTLGGELGELFDANERRPVVGDDGDDFTSDVERDLHMREYRSLKRQLIAHVKARVVEVFTQFTAAGVELTQHDIALKFSKSAGCTFCACSPGFVLDTTVVYGGQPVDLWLERAGDTVEHESSHLTSDDHAGC